MPGATTPGLAAARFGLIWTLVRTDFKVRYHGTVSGFVWALMKPLAMFVVLTAVFSLVFRSEPTYRLDLLIGLFLWDFFADLTKTGFTALHAKGFLLSKARLPPWILVVTSMSNPLVTIAVFSVATLVYLNLTGHPPTLVGYALFLVYVLVMGLLGLGFSLAGERAVSPLSRSQPGLGRRDSSGLLPHARHLSASASSLSVFTSIYISGRRRP